MSFVAAAELREALSMLPRHRYSFAYGSGVMKQMGYGASERPMIDFVLAVDDPAQVGRPCFLP